jgi:hypothetical protein
MTSASATDVRGEVNAAVEARSNGRIELGVPLTEWIFRRLPGPRWSLIVVWVGLVLMTPFAVIGAAHLAQPTREIDVLNEAGPQAVLSYVVALLLYGVGRLVDRAAALGPGVELLVIRPTAPV